MLITIIRTAVLYLVVVLCMRIMGKRQVGELQPSELVVTILISELASIPMQDLNRPVTNGLVAIFVLVLLELIISGLMLKSMFFRKLFEGKAAIIIKNGTIDQKMMKKLRVTIDDLLEGIRQTGNFAVDTIDYAIMETNGKISVLNKNRYLPISRDDMKIKKPEQGLPTVVISDGKLMKKVFDEFQYVSVEDVMQRLKNKNLTVEDVFLMTVNETQDYLIIKKG